MARTVGSLVDHFLKAYGLKKGAISSLHDCVHAMTGLGIGEVNEMRVNAVIDGLENGPPEESFEVPAGYEDVFEMAAQEFQAEAKPAFANRTYSLAQKHAAPLDPREVEAYVRLGREINAAIERHTGVSFGETTYDRLAAADFGKLDFSRQAFNIRSQFETSKNRRVERVSRNALEQEAVRQTGHSDIPSADKPWTQKPGK